MFRPLCFAMCLCASNACAHDFWIASPERVLPPDEPFAPVVWIGDDLLGDQHLWQPLAYAQAFWISPTTVQALHAKVPPNRSATLDAQGLGMHILAVQSFNRRLRYDTLSEFHEFLSEIGRGDVSGSAVEPVEETYRRLSKTLVFFDERVGADRQIGLDSEWVLEPEGYRLFQAAHPVPDQLATVSCRATDGDLWQIEARTDSEGRIPVDLPTSSQCLASTVFLSTPTQAGTWHTDWVSHYHVTAPRSG